MNLVRELRTYHDLSQEEAGVLLGRSRNTIGNWESGRTEPDKGVLALIRELAQTDGTEIRRRLHEEREGKGKLMRFLSEAASTVSVSYGFTGKEPDNGQFGATAERSGTPISFPSGRQASFHLEVIERALNVAPATAGGYLISEGIRERAVQPGTLAGELAKLGARFEIINADESGRLIPVITATPTAEWLPLGQPVTKVIPPIALRQDGLKTVGAGTGMSRRLVVQAGERGYQDVLAALVQGLTDALDDAAISGEGSAAPTGLLMQSGIQTHAATATGAAGFAEAIELLANEGFTNGLGVVAPPSVRKTLSTTVAGGDGFLWKHDGPEQRCFGLPAVAHG